MDTHAFRLRLRDPGVEAHTGSSAMALDGKVDSGSGPRGHWVGFERDAPSFLDAVLSAVAQVIDMGFEPLAVEDELVSMSDIAYRKGRTRQSVAMLFDAVRGPGGFPPPVAGKVRSPLWHWADVAAWFDEYEGGDSEAPDRRSIIAAINGQLASRVLAREQPGELRRIRDQIAIGEEGSG